MAREAVVVVVVLCSVGLAWLEPGLVCAGNRRDRRASKFELTVLDSTAD